MIRKKTKLQQKQCLNPKYFEFWDLILGL